MEALQNKGNDTNNSELQKLLTSKDQITSDSIKKSQIKYI